MRIRTIKQAVACIRESDPGSAISESMIRRAIVAGKIPYGTSGKKLLVAVEMVEQYFSGLDMEPTAWPGKIRKVEV